MTRLHMLHGKHFLMQELAAMSGVNGKTIDTRLRAGWTVEQAVTTPTPAQRRLGIVSNLDRPAEGQTDRLDLADRPKGPGVPLNLDPFMGTGAGSTARETTNITFPEKAEVE